MKYSQRSLPETEEMEEEYDHNPYELMGNKDIEHMERIKLVARQHIDYR